jgi:3-oxoacyl-(acyl-carrier-protein) synthase III
MSVMGTGIVGLGACLPEREVHNEDIADRFGVSPDWFVRKTRIRTRRYAEPGEAASDLAARAGASALEQAGLTAGDIDYLILTTSTGDHLLPPTSHLVQNALGACRAAVFDLNASCAGFTYGLAVAWRMVAAQTGARALVVSVDVYSRFIDQADRATTALFGDGAGAAVVAAVPTGGVIDVELRGRGDEHALLTIEAGGSRVPASAETVANGGHALRMNGRGVADFVRSTVPDLIKDVLARTGTRPADVHHFVPHQANGVIVGELAELAGLTEARTHTTLERYGNLGSASIPVTLEHAHRTGALRDGDLVLLAGFGSGMALGACLLRW